MIKLILSSPLFLSLGRILVGVAACFLVLAAILFLVQRFLIYHPRQYAVAPHALLREHLAAGTAHILEFDVDGKKQLAYLFLNEASPPSAPFGVFFGGNGSLALDWLDLVEVVLPCTRGILLVEYPGYGNNEGRPTRKAIGAVSVMAFEKAAHQVGVAPESLASCSFVMGISLGCAAALEFATGYPVPRAVLLAPFTSLLDMARRVVGWPLCLTLLDRFDNVAALRRIIRARPDFHVLLFHGDADDVVPVTMSRELKALFPEQVTYTEIPGADHVTVLDLAFPEIRKWVCDTLAETTASRSIAHPKPE